MWYNMTRRIIKALGTKKLSMKRKQNVYLCRLSATHALWFMYTEQGLLKIEPIRTL